MDENVFSDESPEEAYERNMKIAMETPMGFSNPDSVGLGVEYPKVENLRGSENSEDIWKYIFFLTDEIKRLKEKYES